MSTIGRQCTIDACVECTHIDVITIKGSEYTDLLGTTLVHTRHLGAIVDNQFFGVIGIRDFRKVHTITVLNTSRHFTVLSGIWMNQIGIPYILAAQTRSTSVSRAGLVVVADIIKLAGATLRIAVVDSTGVTVLTFYAISTIAGLRKAGIERTEIAIITGVGEVTKSRFLVAGIGRADILVRTDNRFIETLPSLRIAGIRCALVCIVAGNRRILTTGGSIALVKGAEIEIFT